MECIHGNMYSNTDHCIIVIIIPKILPLMVRGSEVLTNTSASKVMLGLWSINKVAFLLVVDLLQLAKMQPYMPAW